MATKRNQPDVRQVQQSSFASFSRLVALLAESKTKLMLLGSISIMGSIGEKHHK